MTCTCNGSRRHLRLWGRMICVRVYKHAHAPPGKLDALRYIASEATFGPKRHYSYHCNLYILICMYDSSFYRCPHAMRWAWLKSPNFWVSSAEYYIGLLSLGQGHNVARLDTRAPGSLQQSARLETSWPGQWLRYLAAVVSICGI